MVRAALERHLGSPTSLEVQSELAQWLSDRELIEARDRETVAAKPVTPVVRRRYGAVTGWAAAALAIAGLVWLVTTGALDRTLERLPNATAPTAAIEASANRLTRVFSDETAVFTTVDSTVESALSPLPEQP
jgi:hypothetical protein